MEKTLCPCGLFPVMINDLPTPMLPSCRTYARNRQIMCSPSLTSWHNAIHINPNLQDLRIMLSSGRFLHVIKIPRLCNSASHALANFGMVNQRTQFWLGSVLSFGILFNRIVTTLWSYNIILFPRKKRKEWTITHGPKTKKLQGRQPYI
jgi:hypothetical protein